jgi:hypothetical protein
MNRLCGNNRVESNDLENHDGVRAEFEVPYNLRPKADGPREIKRNAQASAWEKTELRAKCECEPTLAGRGGIGASDWVGARSQAQEVGASSYINFLIMPSRAGRLT